MIYPKLATLIGGRWRRACLCEFGPKMNVEVPRAGFWR